MAYNISSMILYGVVGAIVVTAMYFLIRSYLAKPTEKYTPKVEAVVDIPASPMQAPAPNFADMVGKSEVPVMGLDTNRENYKLLERSMRLPDVPIAQFDVDVASPLAHAHHLRGFDSISMVNKPRSADYSRITAALRGDVPIRMHETSPSCLVEKSRVGPEGHLGRSVFDKRGI